MDRYRRLVRLIFLILLSMALFACAGLKTKNEAHDAFHAGLALFNRGNYEEAIAHFEKATSLDPEFAKAYLYLGRSYANLGKWREAIVPLRSAYRLSPEETKNELADIVLDVLLNYMMRPDDTLQKP